MGNRKAYQNKPHTHWHPHSDGKVHKHEHVHAEEHVHVHEDDDSQYHAVDFIRYFAFWPVRQADSYSDVSVLRDIFSMLFWSA